MLNSARAIRRMLLVLSFLDISVLLQIFSASKVFVTVANNIEEKYATCTLLRNKLAYLTCIAS